MNDQSMTQGGGSETMICLTIAADGTMTVGAGSDMGSMKKVPVKSLDEALSTIKQLAQAAAMPTEQANNPAEETVEGQDPNQTGDDEVQEAAMMNSYRPGQTGR